MVVRVDLLIGTVKAFVSTNLAALSTIGNITTPSDAAAESKGDSSLELMNSEAKKSALTNTLIGSFLANDSDADGDSFTFGGMKSRIQ